MTILGFLVGCGQGNLPEGNGAITGRVYFDKNINESCEECECGIEKIQIRLYQDTCAGEELGAVITDEDGYFSFEKLKPGSYCVFSDLSPSCDDGYLPTTPVSQIVEVGVDERVEIEGFGYGPYLEVNE
jgi:hypothetical protein